MSLAARLLTRSDAASGVAAEEGGESMLRAILRRAFVVVLLAVAAAWWAARPATPDAFYDPPDTVAAMPGALLRHEEFTRDVPPGARAWRLLYTTTRADGAAAVASALVMVSRQAANEPRAVIAWTHGTTGVVPGCAPSLLFHPFANVPALQALLDRGWLFVGTDYVGQGTAGPHPYLIGEGEARVALDAVRAVRRFEAVQAGERTVVWGHSQGGHAALWTGIVAPAYAPDVRLAGVVAVAPASDLRPLIEAIQHTPVGRIMSSFVLRAYGETYADVLPEAYVSVWKRLLARDMASRCLGGRPALFSALEAVAAGGTIFSVPPGGGPLGERLGRNTPDGSITAPLLIAQGSADTLVLPSVQAEYVRRRCAAGQAVDYRPYADRDHLSVVAPNSPLVPDLVRWTADRLAGVPVAPGCSGI